MGKRGHREARVSHAPAMVPVHRLPRLPGHQRHPRRPVRPRHHPSAALPPLPAARHHPAQPPEQRVKEGTRLGIQQAQGQRPRISGGDTMPVPGMPPPPRHMRRAVHRGQPEDRRARRGALARRRRRTDHGHMQVMQQQRRRTAGTRAGKADMTSFFRTQCPRDPHAPASFRVVPNQAGGVREMRGFPCP